MRFFRFLPFVLLMLFLCLASCSTDTPEPEPPVEQPTLPDSTNKPNDDNDNDNNNTSMSNKLKITVGSTSFNVILEDNATAKAFKALLPITVNMSDLNGNEKYFNLSNSLPTTSTAPGTIREGDLMLYGSTCVVLFYETFATGYSYTRIGRVDEPSGLISALGPGNVRVLIETSL